jgi:hypothetical protein
LETLDDMLRTAPVTVTQVKEKFGVLRVYCSIRGRNVERWQRFIDFACAISSRTCELCGRHGALREKGAWVKTLCDSCDAAWQRGA